MAKIHLAVCRPNEYGGFNYDTLCGRESGEFAERADDINSTAEEALVDCKLCLQIMADPSHWRHRRWLAHKAPQRTGEA